jgi:hypothetical protein
LTFIIPSALLVTKGDKNTAWLEVAQQRAPAVVRKTIPFI